MCLYAMAHMWRSKDNFVEFVLSFKLYIVSEVKFRSPDLCGKCLYQLGHLSLPLEILLFWYFGNFVDHATGLVSNAFLI